MSNTSKDINLTNSADLMKALQSKALETVLISAYPPENLPKSLSFKSTEENPIDLDAKITEYAPYYTYKRTIKTTKGRNNFGVICEKTIETLEMKLIDPKPYKQLLMRYKQ